MTTKRFQNNMDLLVILKNINVLLDWIMYQKLLCRDVIRTIGETGIIL